MSSQPPGPGPEFPAPQYPAPDFRAEGQPPPPPPPLPLPVPAPRPASWRRPGLAGLLAVAVAALAGGAGVSYAATRPASTLAADSSATTPGASPGPSASPAPGHHGRARPGRTGGRRLAGPGGPGGLGGVLHAQATVPAPGGGYQTIDTQRGTVTAVSASSITLKSADGFTASYAVRPATQVNAQAAGIGAVKTGDTVQVTATVSGSAATASSITDLTSIGSSRGSFGFRPRGGQPGSKGTGTGSTGAAS